ncbi:hypothetical protein Tco_0098834 [Tanacetum coccineum]
MGTPTQRMGTPTQYLCDYWSGWVRLPRLFADIHCHIALLSTVVILAQLLGLSAGRPAAESLGGGTGVRVGRGGRGRRPREGNDERVDDLNGQGNDQGLGANGGVEGVNGNVKGANGGAPDFSMIIAQQFRTSYQPCWLRLGTEGMLEIRMVMWGNEKFRGDVGNVVLSSPEMQKMESDVVESRLGSGWHADILIGFMSSMLVPFVKS